MGRHRNRPRRKSGKGLGLDQSTKLSYEEWKRGQESVLGPTGRNGRKVELSNNQLMSEFEDWSEGTIGYNNPSKTIEDFTKGNDIQISHHQKELLYNQIVEEQHEDILQEFADFLNGIDIEDRYDLQDAIKNFCEEDDLDYNNEKVRSLLRESITNHEYNNASEFEVSSNGYHLISDEYNPNID